MREADRTIESLLASLREAKPSASMQRRILETLEAREAEGNSSPWQQMLRPAIVVCAAVLAASFVIATTVQRARRAKVEVRSSLATAATPVPKPKAAAQQAPLAARRVVSPPWEKPKHAREVSAVGETRAASCPAPTLPLTEQERLLLRLAHRGDAEEIAILIPEAQEAREAKAMEQFQQFFGINATEMRRELE